MKPAASPAGWPSTTAKCRTRTAGQTRAATITRADSVMIRGSKSARVAGLICAIAAAYVAVMLPERAQAQTVAQSRSSDAEAEAEARRLDEQNSAPREGSCPPPNAREIYYGTPTNQAATVGIRFAENGARQICTGVVIADNAVLTAGHCTCGDSYSYELWFGGEIGGDGVGVRPTAIRSFRGSNGRYDCRRPKAAQPGVDYGLILFDPATVRSRDVSYQIARIMPPSIARQSRLDVGGNLHAVGFGLTENNTLGRKLRVPIPVSSWDCSEGWAARRGCQSFSEIIMSERPGDGRQTLGRDSCGGDSGGPAFAVVATERCNKIEKSHYLVAITSRGMELRSDESTGKPCGGGGVYEVVARRSVLDWLRGNGVVVDLENASPTAPPANASSPGRR